jgi:hypothetical protein
MAPMEYLGAWGTLIHEKKLRSKISCQTPFKKKGRFEQPTSKYFPNPLLVKCVGQKSKGWMEWGKGWGGGE